MLGVQRQNLEIGSKDEADRVLADLKAGEYVVSDITRKRQAAQALCPVHYQQPAAGCRKQAELYHKRSMMVAQQLYEGIEIKGSGTLGLVTYIRTDSVRISDEAKSAAREYIKRKFRRKIYCKQHLFQQEKRYTGCP